MHEKSKNERIIINRHERSPLLFIFFVFSTNSCLQLFPQSISHPAPAFINRISSIDSISNSLQMRRETTAIENRALLLQPLLREFVLFVITISRWLRVCTVCECLDGIAYLGCFGGVLWSVIDINTWNGMECECVLSIEILFHWFFRLVLFRYHHHQLFSVANVLRMVNWYYWTPLPTFKLFVPCLIIV